MSTDITGKPDEYGITLLCTFGEEVKTAAGTVVPTCMGFEVYLGERKPLLFKTARPAVRRLRAATNARKFLAETQPSN